MPPPAAVRGCPQPSQSAPPRARGARKRAQVAEFAAVLPLLADLDGKTVVDCGCSSGNLIRPLAPRFPKTTFVGLDIKPLSLIHI